MIGVDPSLFEEFFSSAMPVIESGAIRQEWLALEPPYVINARRLPKPVWARQGYSENGQEAWEKLQNQMGQIDPGRAYCIYIHVPFCDIKCGFCDCYSFRLGQHATRHIDAYLAALEQEMQLWSRLGNLAERPVSTIYFGGGTPLFLGEDGFSRLVQNCRRYFNTGPQTEWALETTSSELSESMFSRLDSLGFTRLHVGVQSLNDSIRTLIDRREPASTVLKKLSKAITLGWVTSVDLIFGLPAQSLVSLLDDIHRLADAGVDGFSMYELQRSSQNRRFIEQHNLAGKDRTLDYFLLQAASQRLDQLGFKKILFNHFANDRDKDLYFTFPERGEDCLAMGTIADGVINGYHYRHPEYSPYCRGVTGTFPGLEGGVRQSDQDGRFAALETAILSARLSKELFVGVLGDEAANLLLQKWSGAALIARDKQDDHQYHLTTNGSWFAGEMMAQLADHAIP